MASSLPAPTHPSSASAYVPPANKRQRDPITGGASASASQVPLCKRHELPCVSFLCKKETVNKGRKFWTCSVRDAGSCTFIWDSDLRRTPGLKFASATGQTADGQQLVSVTVQLVSEQYCSVSFTPYHAAIGDVVKANHGCWDAEAKLWIAPLSAHEDLVTALRSMPNLRAKVDAIPKCVLEAFGVVVASKAGSAKKAKISPPIVTDVVPYDDRKLPERLRAVLLPFQREGVHYALQHGGRVLIGDEMGLGKTLQAIAVMLHYQHEWPALVLAPSSLRFNWQDEFRKWVPSLPLSAVQVVLTSKGVGPLGRSPITVISYDLAARMADEIISANFQVVVCDESHYLKTATAKRSLVVCTLLKQAKRAILLSGTPALNRPIELHTQVALANDCLALRSTAKLSPCTLTYLFLFTSQISALRPDLYPSMNEFGVRYCAATQGRFGWEYKGATNLTELHLVLTRHVMIRRTKDQVLTQLPSKRRQAISIHVPKGTVGCKPVRMHW